MSTNLSAVHIDALQRVAGANQDDKAFVFYRDEFGSILDGDCDQWSRFARSTLAVDADATTVTRIRVLQWSLNTLAPSASINARASMCDNATVANRVAELLRTLPASALDGSAISLQCADTTWRVAVCSGNLVPSLCVNCTDPCACRSAMTASAPPLVPCDEAHNCSDDGMAQVSLLLFTVAPLFVVPVVNQTKTAITRVDSSSVSLQTLLDNPSTTIGGDGIGYIRAATLSPSDALNLTTTTARTFLLQTQDAHEEYYNGDLDQFVTINFTNLDPLSTYSILIGARDLAGHMSYAEDLMLLHNVTTACCWAVEVDTSSGVLQTLLAPNESSREFVLGVYAGAAAAAAKDFGLVVNVSAKFSRFDTPSSSAASSCPSLTAAQFHTLPHQGSEIFTGNEFRFDDASPSKTNPKRLEHRFVVNAGGSAGCVYVLVDISPGSGREGFRVSWPAAGAAGAVASVGLGTPNSAQGVPVVPINGEPSAPSLSGARFSSTGTTLEMEFSHATDRGGHGSASFTCDRVVTMLNGSASSCLWTDDALLRAALPSSAAIAVGDEITLLPDTLRAACTVDDGNCSSWSWANETKATVAAPLKVLPVEFSLALPQTVSICEAARISVAVSQGSLGRAWRTVKWLASPTVSTSDTHLQRAEKLAAFLQANGTVDVPFSIPTSLLEALAGGAYTITLSLENAFGTKASSSSSLSVSGAPEGVPTVQIDGPPTLSFVLGTDIVRLVARASVPVPCAESAADNGTDGTVSTSTLLSFLWSIFSDEASLSSGQGVSFTASGNSSTSSTLVLLPGAIVSAQVGNRYIAQVSVMSNAGQIATASVLLSVSSGKVIAALVDASRLRTVSVSSVVVLNASESYDENTVHLSPVSSRPPLLFSWTCQDTTDGLYLATSCPENIASIDNASSTFVMPNATLVEGRRYRFTVRVSSAADASRYDTEYVELAAVRSSAVQITETVGPKLVNPGTTSALLFATVDSAYPVHMSWTLSTTTGDGTTTTSIVSGLDDVALTTTTSRTFPSGVFAFPLLLRPDALESGVSYAFDFSASATDDNGTSTTAFSQIVVQSNDPPRAGRLVLSSDAVVAMNETLEAVAPGWVDDPEHLPLQYEFFSGNDLWQEISLVSVASGILPEGLQSAHYMIDISVSVSDKLGAKTSPRTSSAVRSRFATPPSAAVLFDALDTEIAAAASTQNTDTALQAVGAVSSALSTTNCTLAPPNCSAILRGDCSDGSVPHTCGECVLGSVGEVGASNDPCTRDDRNNTAVGTLSSRQLHSDTLWCPANCSGHGYCEWLDYNLVVLVNTSCTMAEAAHCTARCVCEPEWNGTSACSVSSAEATQRQSVRELALTSLSGLRSWRAASARPLSVIVYQAVVLRQLSDDAMAWSADFMLEVAHVLEALLGDLAAVASAGDSSNDVATELFSIVGSILPYTVGLPRVRSSLLSAMVQLQSLMSETQVAGQHVSDLVGTEVRTRAITVFQDGPGLDNQTFAAPQSVTEEMLLGSRHPSMHISRKVFQWCGATSADAVGMNLAGFGSNPYASGGQGANENAPVSSVFRAVPRLQSALDSSAPYLSGRAMVDEPTFTVILWKRTDQSAQQLSLNQSESRNVSLLCRDDGGPRNKTVYCPGRPPQQLRCADAPNSTVLTATCTTHTQPKCSIWNGTAFATAEACRVVESGSLFTTCQCNATLMCDTLLANSRYRVRRSGVTGRRVLQAVARSNEDDDDGIGTGSTDPASLNFGATAEAVGSDFVQTWESAEDLTADDLEDNIIMLACLAGFLILTLGAMVTACVADAVQHRRAKTHTVAVAPIANTDDQACPSACGDGLPSKPKAAWASPEGQEDSASAPESTRIDELCAVVADFVEEAMPLVFRKNLGFGDRVKYVLLHNHSWFSLWRFEKHEPRVWRLLGATSFMSTLMFITAVLFVLIYPDPGCDEASTEEECEDMTTVADSSQRACLWQTTSTDGRGECTFANPSTSLLMSLYITLIAGILTAPFVVLINYLITNYLACETQLRDNDGDDDHEQNAGFDSHAAREDAAVLAVPSFAAPGSSLGKLHSLSPATPTTTTSPAGPLAGAMLAQQSSSSSADQLFRSVSDVPTTTRVSPKPLKRGFSTQRLGSSPIVAPANDDVYEHSTRYSSSSPRSGAVPRTTPSSTAVATARRNQSRHAVSTQQCTPIGGTAETLSELVAPARPRLRTRVSSQEIVRTNHKLLAALHQARHGHDGDEEGDRKNVDSPTLVAADVSDMQARAQLHVKERKSVHDRNALVSTRPLVPSISTLLVEEMHTILGDLNEFAATLPEGSPHLHRLFQAWRLAFRQARARSGDGGACYGTACGPGSLPGDDDGLSPDSADGVFIEHLVNTLMQTRKHAAELMNDFAHMPDNSAASGMLLEYAAVDMLPSTAQSVFRRNIKEHYEEAREVPLWKKCIAAAFLFLHNLMCCFYVFLFSVRLGRKLQLAWLNAVSTGVCFDVLVYEFAAVLLIWFVWPLLVHRDVAAFRADVERAAQRLVAPPGWTDTTNDTLMSSQMRLEDAVAIVPELEDDLVWRVSPLRAVFPSLRVAAAHPELSAAHVLREMLIQRTAEAPWNPQTKIPPPKSTRGRGAVHRQQEERARAEAAIAGLFARDTHWSVFRSFAGMSGLAQDLWLSVVTPITLSILVALHAVLFDIHPALAFVPLTALILYISILFLVGQQRRSGKSGRHLRETGGSSAEEHAGTTLHEDDTREESAEVRHIGAACKRGDVVELRAAVGRGVNLLAFQDSRQRTTLMVCCAFGQSEACAYILQLMVVTNDFNALDTVDENGCTALMFACFGGHDECVRLLLLYNVDVNIQHPGTGNTALMFACRKQHVECARLLRACPLLNQAAQNHRGQSAERIEELVRRADRKERARAKMKAQTSLLRNKRSPPQCAQKGGRQDTSKANGNDNSDGCDGSNGDDDRSLNAI